jgi:prophage regulatory protein
MTGQPKKNIRFIRLRTVVNKTGLSRSTIYNKIKSGSKYFDPTFPNQIKLGGGAVAWIECEVDDWMLSQIEITRS